MTLADALIKELRYESGKSKKMIERVPQDNMGWKIHEKSMPIGRLAQHIASTPIWAGRTLDSDHIDFGNGSVPPPIGPLESVDEILTLFSQKIDEAVETFAKYPDEHYHAQWEMRNAGNILFARPRIDVIRDFLFNHTIHHRGQLSVYLRVLDIPVPGMYGPSADEGRG